MVHSDIEQLQSKLNQHTRGLVWITTEPLEKFPRPYYALDYFLNGLLLNMVKNQEESLSKNLFCTQHFGKSFFLGHLDSRSDSLDTDIVSIMSWVKTQLADGDKVVVLDQSSKKVTNALSKKYPKLKFEEIILN
ncbi:MAG: hypothetical protein ACJAT2_001658 [Bacteriovoracaceae bacterium]|jgi:hypothetical protein